MRARSELTKVNVVHITDMALVQIVGGCASSIQSTCLLLVDDFRLDFLNSISDKLFNFVSLSLLRSNINERFNVFMR